MFDRILIANRGEIALRVMRTCERLGIETVAVYSEADANAAHVRAANLAVRLGPAPAAQSYLDIDKVIQAAKDTGAQAIHPGYGFLSENAAFAAACDDAGIVFLGPTADSIRTMGDKITAKQAVAKRDVPLVPGIAEPGLSDEQLIAAADDIGFPVLIKPSAGGGGKGMHAVFDKAELPEALAAARREAASSFGDDTLFLERLVATPRHIEVQVMADEHGNVVHFGERECSLQRRHQKVIEEAPSALLDDATRARIGEAAVQTAKSVGYRGAGTVEFIVSADQPEEFFFMEMNTRLQVEHPVTEEVTGFDLVELQLRVGDGQELGIAQQDVAMFGHAVEARVYAEDPARGFLPTGGTAIDVVFPDIDGLRVDPGLDAGQTVPGDYDPMIAKVIGTGADRESALAQLRAGLAGTSVPGITTNIGFLRTLLSMPQVIAGDIDTGLIDGLAESQLAVADHAAEALLAAAAVVATRGRAASDPAYDGPLTEHSVSGPFGRTGTGASAAVARGERGPEPAGEWDRASGWRAGNPAPVTTVTLKDSDPAADGPVVIDYDFPQVSVRDDVWTLTQDGVQQSARIWARSADQTIWVAGNAGTFSFALPRSAAAAAEAAAGAEIVAPMPGTVINVKVADGDAVSAGDPIVVVEAMKMEHVLRAPTDGTVHLSVNAGAQVSLEEVLATVSSDDETGTAETGADKTGNDAAGA